MTQQPALNHPGAEAGRSPAGSGLSSAEVLARTEAGLVNTVSEAPSRTLGQIFRANLLTLFNAIVGCSFGLLLFLGQWKDALFGLAAAGNILVGVVQEYRAKKSLDRLAILDASRARVVRDGTAQAVDTQDVVRDDVLLLRVGDQVPADASIIDGEGLELDESLLTGESRPVSKGPGSEVLSGSSVVAGHGRARVVRVGADSFASKLTAEAKRFSMVNSEIRNSLNRILRSITWLLPPLMILVINGEMQASGGWEQAITTGSWRTASVGAVASAIAMIPLGLVLLSSVAFAVGALRLARQKVLIQELAAVEGLARVDVFCLDKTGTLTEGKLVFDGVHQAGASPKPGWRQVLGWFGTDPQANATARCLAGAFPRAPAFARARRCRSPLHGNGVPSASAQTNWSAAPGCWALRRLSFRKTPQAQLASLTPQHVWPPPACAPWSWPICPARCRHGMQRRINRRPIVPRYAC
ncbi:HAD-IC family P-type ATPase [Arthrobacter sp. efr-133-R2A-120]|uniref:HAD-IC family P-type ATPase n=1 Tax=Arthrobacter sp. efr-133-R2A-120 TaxID=3040277 RepID=UPI00254E2DC8|nr:HAD-IC family P-type ATPase [Arthrobacter sp. efr-133-R2A-120]